MASNCITRGADYFKTAVAVAPVTNWRYYDNIYTERYMRTPQENADGYDSNSPINHVEKIKGNYLLVHGTADDNVHFQNAVEMAKAMNEKNIIQTPITAFAVAKCACICSPKSATTLKRIYKSKLIYK